MNKLQEKLFYHKLYKNKIIILKIGGTEIASPKILETIKQIQKLAKIGIKFIIVFGGGAQIDKEWSCNHKKLRPKKDGIGVTTQEVLERAVIPAYSKIIDFFKKEFASNVHFFSSDDIICEYKNKPKFGEVGKVININKNKKMPAISIIGFVGKLKTNNQYANINADEIVLSLLKNFSEIAEIIFLTPKGCVFDIKNNRVGVITRNTLYRIIRGEQKKVKVDGGMLQKLKEIKKLLSIIPKIAITNLDSLAQELETCKGSGTLVLDTSKHVIKKITLEEEPIIEKILHFYQKDDETFRWSIKEFKEILANHYVFKIKNSPLGGFSFFEDKDSIVIKALWSDHIGIGIIKTIIKNLQNQAKLKNKVLYVVSGNKKINKILIENKIENKNIWKK